MGKAKKHQVFFLESDIRRAMKFTKSNMAAARYLNIDYLTYRKYARLYYNEEGVSLFDLHLNKEGRGINKREGMTREDANHPLESILNNQFDTYPLQKLGQKLVKQGLLLPRCSLCGCDEFRITDKKYPLILTQKNGNVHDYRIENLELLCYNCYFLTVGNLNRKVLQYFKG